MRRNKNNRPKRMRNLFKSFGMTHGFWPRTWITVKIIALILWRICLVFLAIYLGVFAIGLLIVLLLAKLINDSYYDQQARTVHVRYHYWW